MATRFRGGAGLPLAGGGGYRRNNQLHQSTPLTLTNAQIITLPTTGVEVVPDPGGGLIILPVFGMGTVNTVAGVYSGSASDASWNLIWENGDYASLPAQMNAALADNDQITPFTLIPEVGIGSGTWDGAMVTRQSGAFSTWGGALVIKDDFAGIVDYGGGHADNSAMLTLLYYLYNPTTGQFQ